MIRADGNEEMGRVIQDIAIRSLEAILLVLGISFRNRTPVLKTSSRFATRKTPNHHKCPSL